jgi:hypothetical protein
MEEIWDKSLEKQVVSRAYRMGAQASVRVEKLMMIGTVEELMHQIGSRMNEAPSVEGDAEAEGLARSESPATDPDADGSVLSRSDSVSSSMEGSTTSGPSGSSSTAVSSSSGGAPRTSRRKSKSKSKAAVAKRNPSGQASYEQAKVRWLLASLDLVDMPELPPCSSPTGSTTGISTSAMSVPETEEEVVPALLGIQHSSTSAAVVEPPAKKSVRFQFD